MTPRRHRSARGTVILVAMCFAAVIAISLSSYLAIARVSMEQSNRSFQTDLSKQLAEAGLETALAAANTNDWSGWTLSGTTATRTVTFAEGPAKYGGIGVTGTIKLRVDNYNAHNQSAAWNSSTTYRINDLVGNNGIWYRSVRHENLNRTPASGSGSPNLNFWVPEPIPWMWSRAFAATDYSSDTSYALYQTVNYDGVWYRCITAAPSGTPASAPSLPQEWSAASVSYIRSTMVSYAGRFYRCISDHTSSVGILPTNTTYWSSTLYWIPILTARPWTASTAFVVGDVVNNAGDQYRCATSHTSSANFAADGANWASFPTALSLAWQTNADYSKGAFVYYGGTWYYCIASHNSGGWFDSTKWAAIGGYTLNPSADTWSSSVTYQTGDYAYQGSTWYRCLQAHSNQAPPNATYWAASAPYFHLAYRSSGITYTFNHKLYYGDIWYIYGSGGWISNFTNSMWLWNSSLAYSIGDVVYRNSSWYRCIRAHTTSQAPPSAYWTDAPLQSAAWNPGRQYSQNDTIFYNGVWYLSLLSNNYGQNPATATSWWVGTTNSSYQWDSSTSYAVNNYRHYGGVWYRCLAAGSNKTPNNTGYWTASWAQSSGVTTGAPVIYSEGIATPPSGPAIITQLRATAGPAPLLPNAAAATSTLRLGAGGTVDSYDGSVTTINTAGNLTSYSYNQTTSPFSSAPGSNLGYSAVLAGRSTTGNAVDISSSTVKGYLAAPSVSYSTSASLRQPDGVTVTSPAPSAAGVDLTRISRSPYIPISGIFAVPGGIPIPTPNSTILGMPGGTTPSVYYFTGNLSLNSATRNLTIIGPVILYVSGNLILSSNAGAAITIAATGSLRLVVGRDFRVESPSAGFRNLTYDSKRLTVNLARVGSDTFNFTSTTNPFYGTIYLPDSSSTFTFGNGVNIYGALSAQNITLSGSASIHFDTSLRHVPLGGTDSPYVINDWRELGAAERASL